MTDRARIRRQELAVALVALAAAVAFVIVSLDAIRFHAHARLGDLPFETVVLSALGLVLAAVLGAALLSAARQLLGQRRLIASLSPAGATTIEGREVVVVRGAAVRAFCGGFAQPRIYVSEGALRRLGRDELRAVVAHEASHADRRDPLRLLIGGSIASGLRAIPAARALARRQAELAELAADAAAVAALGSPAPLAAALLAFDDEADGAVAPERVDLLAGVVPRGWMPAGIAALGLAALCVVACLFAVLPGHPHVPATSLPLCVLALPLLASPPWLALRRLRRTHVRRPT
jgi:hypothetical protein